MNSPVANVEAPEPASIWERIQKDLVEKRKRYVSLLLLVAALIIGGTLVSRSISGARERREQEIADSIADAMAELQKAPPGAVWAGRSEAKLDHALKNLEGQRDAALESEQSATYLFTLARVYQASASAAATADDRISLYSKEIETLGELRRRHSESAWVKTPIAIGKTQSAAAGMEDFARKQIEWIKANGILSSVPADKDLEATVHLENGKAVTLRFYSLAAPTHVANFVRLVREKKFYDGTAVHRILKDADGKIQGVAFGDPFTRLTPDDASDDGTGGPGYTLPNEYSALLQHKRGRVSMLQLEGSAEDNGSQFVILLSDVPAWNYARTVFAEVVSGLDAIEEIAEARKDDPDGKPATRVGVKSIELKGEPEHASDDPVTDEIKDPEVKKPETAASAPTETGPR